MVLPPAVPVMTLPNAILFPQVMLPLFIFEPRYRRMLKDVLEGERVFAVAMQKPGSTKGTPSNVAGLGLVRAAVTHADGTSHLILQGMARIELTETVKQRPYRLEKFRLLQTEGNNNVVVDALTEKVLDLVAERFKSGLPFPILNQLLKMLAPYPVTSIRETGTPLESFNLLDKLSTPIRNSLLNISVTRWPRLLSPDFMPNIFSRLFC